MISSLILFFLISVLSVQNKMTYFDQTIISWLTDGSTTYFLIIMETMTKVGSAEVILITTFFITAFLLFKKMYSQIVFLSILTIGGITLNFLLKILFQRERPGEMSVIEVFGYALEISSYSFPSGHTMRSVILFSFLIYISNHFIKKTKVRISAILILSILIFTISISRIIVGAHFPSDIFAAITISITWFYFCLLTLRRFSVESYYAKV